MLNQNLYLKEKITLNNNISINSNRLNLKIKWTYSKPWFNPSLLKINKNISDVF